MLAGSAPALTELLEASRRGDARARARLFSTVYSQLHGLARRARGGSKAHATLDTTGLVHEAYLKLTRSDDRHWENRAHFFAVAARAMRQIVIDGARRRALRHPPGGRSEGVDVSAPHVDLDTALSVENALVRLEQADARLAQLVVLRYFGGLEETEIADVLDVSTRTVRRDWRRARAFLLASLGTAAAGSPS